jgi:ankyrin repeat protein
MTPRNSNLKHFSVSTVGAPLDVIRYLVEEYSKSPQMTNNDGNLPLHCACSCGAPLNIVRYFGMYLVEAYPESLQLNNNDGNLLLNSSGGKRGGDGRRSVFGARVSRVSPS